MNTLKTTAIIAFATFTASVEAQEQTVNTSESKVVWKGYKVAGSHEGTIKIESGTLQFNGEQLTGGEFVMDMTSINTTDLEGEYKDQLDGHLKSDDFFGVETHPTAKLVFTKVTPSGKNAYDVQGSLTIKGITNPISFTLSVYGSKATVNLKIDRSQYNVRYGSKSFFNNLKDKAIYDEFDIVADLQF